jgi:hypothetical protein
MKKQRIEGCLSFCKKDNCPVSCCDDVGVEEWIMEYLIFHERQKDFLKEKGIKFEFKGDRVGITNCSNGKECKFLKYATNETIDSRPIDCKIYPYHVDWKEMDFGNKKVNLYFADFDCPLTKKKISSEFKSYVKHILQRDFSLLFYGLDFKIIFHDFCKYDTYKKH